MPTLQQLLAKDYNPANPSEQIGDLQGASLETRNELLDQLYRQWDHPLTNVYEAGPVDQLASRYREAGQSRREGLQQRGLEYSGAADQTDRALRELYSNGLLDIVLQGGQSEEERKRQLLQQLLGVGEADLDFLDALQSSTLEESGANLDAEAFKRERVRNFMVGALQIAATVGGGAYGAMGGAGSGSALGGASGFGGAGAGVGGAAVGSLGANRIASNYLGGSSAGLPSAGPTPANVDVAGANAYGGRPTSTNSYGYTVGAGNVGYNAPANTQFQDLLNRVHLNYGG